MFQKAFMTYSISATKDSKRSGMKQFEKNIRSQKITALSN